MSYLNKLCKCYTNITDVHSSTFVPGALGGQKRTSGYSQNCSYTQLRVTLWILGNKPGSPARLHTSLNQWDPQGSVCKRGDRKIGKRERQRTTPRKHYVPDTTEITHKNHRH